MTGKPLESQAAEGHSRRYSMKRALAGKDLVLTMEKNSDII